MGGIKLISLYMDRFKQPENWDGGRSYFIKRYVDTGKTEEEAIKKWDDILPIIEAKERDELSERLEFIKNFDRDEYYNNSNDKEKFLFFEKIFQEEECPEKSLAEFIADIECPKKSLAEFIANTPCWKSHFI